MYGETLLSTRWLGVVACASLALLLAGCCGGDEIKHSCTSGMEYKGGSYSAKGTSSDTRASAKRRAEAGVCLDYCQRGDPAVNAAWDKYKATDKGKKSSASKSFDLGFEPSLKHIYETCKKSCEADLATNKMTVTTRCD